MSDAVAVRRAGRRAMYDGLYRMLDVEVVAHADHPTLDRAVAGLDRGERVQRRATRRPY